MKSTAWAAAAALVAFPVVAGATESSATRLVTLGTQGGPRINSTRAQPANLLTVNGTQYLFDAGNGVARQLALAHVPLVSIGRVFISHNHDDHDADWGTLMGLEWSQGRTEPIEVYGPRGTEQMLLGFLQYFAPNVANRKFPGTHATAPEAVLHAHDIAQDGLVYEDANIRVTAMENCHYHYVEGQPGYGWQKSYAFRVQTPDKLIVFSGDTGDCGQRLVAFARNADLLVHEVVDVAGIGARLAHDPNMKYSAQQLAGLMQHMRDEHTSPEDIGRLAAAAGVHQVVLSHLVPGSDDLPDSAYAEGVQKHFKGPVVVAKDLMEFH